MIHAPLTHGGEGEGQPVLDSMVKQLIINLNTIDVPSVLEGKYNPSRAVMDKVVVVIYQTILHCCNTLLPPFHRDRMSCIHLI